MPAGLRAGVGALASAGLLLAVAACGGGGSAADTASGGSGPSVVVLPAISGDPSSTTVTTTAAAATSATGSSTVTGSASSSTSRAGGVTSAPGAAPAAIGPGARPGSYPVHVTSSSNLGKPYDGDATLTVAPASAAGTQVDQTSTSNGESGGSLTLDYLPDGEVTLTSLQSGPSTSGGPATGCPPFGTVFAPAIELVPATLAVGASWTGPVGGGAFTGTASGSVTGPGSDTVGGAAVPVWRLHGTVSLAGRYCGMNVNLTLTLDSDWAPSIHLPAASTIGVSGTAGIFHVSARSVTTLLATSPSPG